MQQILRYQVLSFTVTEGKIYVRDKNLIQLKNRYFVNLKIQVYKLFTAILDIIFVYVKLTISKENLITDI